MTIRADFFTDQTNTPSSNWTTHGDEGTTITAYSGGVQSETTSSYFGAVWKASVDDFGADQFAEARIYTIADNSDWYGLGVRMNEPSAEPESYHCYIKYGDTTLQLRKYVAGSESTVGSSVSYTWVDGDLLRIQAEGTTIKVFVNGVEKISETDSDVSDGQPGIKGYNADNSGIIDQWIAGDEVDRFPVRYREVAGTGNTTASQTSISDTFDGAPVSGNLLIAFLVIGTTDPGTITVPSGWTAIGTAIERSDCSGHMAYKISDGTETGNITWNWVNGTAKQAIEIYEWKLQNAALDKESQADTGGTPATSLATGTTGTLSSAESLAIAFWGAESHDNTETGPTFTSPFDLIFHSGGPGTIGRLSAFANLTGTTAVNPTFTTTDTGDDMWGKVAVFYESSGVDIPIEVPLGPVW